MLQIVVQYFPNDNFGYGHVNIEVSDEKDKYLIEAKYIAYNNNGQVSRDNSIRLELPETEKMKKKGTTAKGLADTYCPKNVKYFLAQDGRLYMAENTDKCQSYNFFTRNCTYFARSFLSFAGYTGAFTDKKNYSYIETPNALMGMLLDHTRLLENDKNALRKSLYWIPRYRLLSVINTALLCVLLGLILNSTLGAVMMGILASISISVLFFTPSRYNFLFLLIASSSVLLLLGPSQISNFWSVNNIPSFIEHWALVAGFLLLLALYLCQHDAKFFQDQLSKLQGESNNQNSGPSKDQLQSQ
jgi:hypothetical protein